MYVGYIVVSGALCTFGIVGFRVLIQSSKSSGFVETRIEDFLLKTQVSVEIGISTPSPSLP